MTDVDMTSTTTIEFSWMKEQYTIPANIYFTTGKKERKKAAYWYGLASELDCLGHELVIMQRTYRR
jgi:hypothetical protein